MMQEKKYSIVHVIDTLEAGGAERVLVTLCNLFFEHGHKVSVITTLQKGPLAAQLAAGIEVMELNRKSKWHLGSMKKLVAWCRPFDVVHVHSSHNLRYVFLAAKLFGLRKRIFFHEHFGNIEIDNSVSWHQRLIYPQTVLIAVSRKIEQWAIDKLKMDTNKVFLLPNIVAKEKVVPLIQEQETGVLRLLLVSNFRRPKHIEFAVGLIGFIKQQQQVHLTIVGQMADEVYCNETKALIAAQQLQHDISIVHDCSSVQGMLQQFHMAIHTAKTESGPLVLIEYMAQGLPFLSYKTGEVAYQVESQVPECLISNFNEHDWWERMQQLLEDKKRLSNKLESLYEQYYSEDSYYENCLGIYDKALLH